MPVPSRQRMPALLQVDAVLGRLKGREALQEVCRYLHEEFPSYSHVRVSGTDPGAAPFAASESDLPPPSTEGKAGGPSGSSELQVDVVRGAVILGRLTVVADRPPPLDASDRSFLTEVARRLAAEIPAG